MKRTLLSFVAGAVAISAFAQTMEVKETSFELHNSARPALSIDMPEVSSKTVEKEWKNLMKEYNPESFKSKKLMFADDASISNISNNPVDIYAKAEEENNTTTLVVVVDMGKAYLNADHGEKLVAMKGMLKNFAVSVTKETYGERIKEQEEIVSDLTKDIDKATSKKEDIEKDIKSYEKDLNDDKKELEEQSQSIEQKRQNLETGKSLDGKEDMVKELQKDYDKALSTKEKLEKSIRSNEKKLNSSNEKIQDLSTTIKEKSAELEKEKKVLENLKSESKKIK